MEWAMDKSWKVVVYSSTHATKRLRIIVPVQFIFQFSLQLVTQFNKNFAIFFDFLKF